MTFRDKRRHKIDNYVTGRWVLTIKVDKDGQFKKFKARWVCRGFQDAQKIDLQTDSPTATRYGFRVASQHAASMYWDFTPFRLENCLPSGGNIRLRPTRLSMFSCLLTLVYLLTWLVYALVQSMDLRTP